MGPLCEPWLEVAPGVQGIVGPEIFDVRRPIDQNWKMIDRPAARKRFWAKLIRLSRVIVKRKYRTHSLIIQFCLWHPQSLYWYREYRDTSTVFKNTIHIHLAPCVVLICYSSDSRRRPFFDINLTPLAGKCLPPAGQNQDIFVRNSSSILNIFETVKLFQN